MNYFILRLNHNEEIAVNLQHVVMIEKYMGYTEFLLDHGPSFKVEDKDGSIFNEYFDLVRDPIILN